MDLSTLKSDIHLGLLTSVNYHFFEQINPHVYLVEVNNCILSTLKSDEALQMGLGEQKKGV